MYFEITVVLLSRNEGDSNSLHCFEEMFTPPRKAFVHINLKENEPFSAALNTQFWLIP